MSDTWYVWYDCVPRHYEHGTDSGLELFTDYAVANKRYWEIKLRLFEEAKWESGKPDGGDYYYEYPDGDVDYCSHLALRIGKAEWK